jgi:Na+/melibiose symporter-like transporter
LRNAPRRPAVVYLALRLATTVTNLYLVSFIEETLRMEPVSVATIPFVIYACSLAAAGGLGRLAKLVGRRTLFVFGAVLFVGACVLISFVPPEYGALMYPLVACIGFGSATATVNVATLQSDLLGTDLRSAAFVFGVMSMADKVHAGVIILGLQIYSDGPARGNLPEFYRYVQSAVPAIAMTVAVLAALTTKALRFGGAAEQAAAAKALADKSAVANPLAGVAAGPSNLSAGSAQRLAQLSAVSTPPKAGATAEAVAGLSGR